jgi:hypothetical protein
MFNSLYFGTGRIFHFLIDAFIIHIFLGVYLFEQTNYLPIKFGAHMKSLRCYRADSQLLLLKLLHHTGRVPRLKRLKAGNLKPKF